jgi:hypothetical protein
MPTDAPCKRCGAYCGDAIECDLALDGVSPDLWTNPAPPEPQLQCCGQWIDYPRGKESSQCPVCRTTFTVALDPAMAAIIAAANAR